MLREGVVRLPRGTLHLFRTRMLLDGCWLECVRVANYGLEPLETPLTIQFDADFADVFEVRGTRRAARGQRLPGTSGSESIMRYQGLDGV
jgi:glycogen debranching enzyme